MRRIVMSRIRVFYWFILLSINQIFGVIHFRAKILILYGTFINRLNLPVKKITKRIIEIEKIIGVIGIVNPTIKIYK